MAEEKEDNTDNRRTQVNDLPREEKELTADEQKKVQGGTGGAAKPAPPGTNSGYSIWPADRENA